VSQFEKGKWNELGDWADLNFSVEPKGYAVFKFRRVAAPAPPAPEKQ